MISFDPKETGFPTQNQDPFISFDYFFDQIKSAQQSLDNYELLLADMPLSDGILACIGFCLRNKLLLQTPAARCLENLLLAYPEIINGSERLLLSLFQAPDELHEASLGPNDLLPALHTLLDWGANPNCRDERGNSPLGLLNERLSQIQSSWSQQNAKNAYLECANVLLAGGALPESVIPAPPLERVVSDLELLSLLKAEMEARQISSQIENALSQCPSANPQAQSPAGQECEPDNKSKRL